MFFLPLLLAFYYPVLMSRQLPDTPSEVHGRVYRRAIAPLLEEEPYSAEDVIRAALTDLLLPLDLTTYPTTYGPQDEDPYYPLGVAARSITQEELFPKIVTGRDAQNVLKTAFEAMRSEQAQTLAQRLSGPIELPLSLPSEPLEVVFPSSHVLALRHLAEQLTPPRSVQQLFIPSSRYFLCGYTTVSSAPTIKYTHTDVIDVHWKVAPEVGEYMRRVGVHAPKEYTGLQPIWDRWKGLNTVATETRLLTYTPPLVPLDHTPSDFRYLFAGTETRRERDTTPGTAWEGVLLEMDGNDIDPFALDLLDEMDDTAGFELSDSTLVPSKSSSRPSRSAWIEETEESYIEPWSHTELSVRSEWDDNGGEAVPLPHWDENEWDNLPQTKGSEHEWSDQHESDAFSRPPAEYYASPTPDSSLYAAYGDTPPGPSRSYLFNPYGPNYYEPRPRYGVWRQYREDTRWDAAGEKQHAYPPERSWQEHCHARDRSHGEHGSWKANEAYRQPHPNTQPQREAYDEHAKAQFAPSAPTRP